MEKETRYERAANYYNSAKKYAEVNKIDFNWKFISMPDVCHNSSQVVPFAVEVINLT